MCQSLLARAGAVLLFAFAAYADGLPQSRFTTVDLSDYFTMDAVSTASAPAEGEIDGEYAFPASRLPTPGTVELLDAVFRFPPTDGDRLNAFVPKGQTVEVPRGRYESVLFLGASVHGSAETKVELTIELDGRVGEIEETLRFTNWCTPKKFGELVAAECPYRLGAGGEAPPTNYLWLQPIYLPEGAVLRAIKFHDQWKFRIFAITLDRERYELPTPERFEYLLYRVERLAPSGEAFAEAFRTLDGLSTALGIPWVAEDLARMRDLFVDRYDYDDLFTEVVEPLEQKLAPFIERVAELDDRTRQWLERQPDDPDFNATLVGHSHLDAAWLWSKHE
ncbi:MAG: hypothetical protein GF419_05015, partial [Ignavibacteriales bacterium]|nr:hypothetical protein [Ignavibacteriales bacterium]